MTNAARLLFIVELARIFGLAHGAFSGRPPFATRAFDQREHHGLAANPESTFDARSLGMRRDESASSACPQYEAMQLQPSWQIGADGSRRLHVALPGVDPRNRHARLSDDGSLLQVSAARELPARGRACIPRTARVSADGRYELFKDVVPLPGGYDSRRMQIQHAHSGLEFILPPQNLWSPPTRLATDSRGSSSAASVGQPPMVDPSLSQPSLPYPSDGIEVVDEEYQWPEKSPDAVEGFYDNRGDFHEY